MTLKISPKLEEARASTLTDYIRNLLRDGKRSQHDDFRALFELYGEKKITEMAKQLLKEERGKK